MSEKKNNKIEIKNIEQPDESTSARQVEIGIRTAAKDVIKEPKKKNYLKWFVLLLTAGILFLFLNLYKNTDVLQIDDEKKKEKQEESFADVSPKNSTELELQSSGETTKKVENIIENANKSESEEEKLSEIEAEKTSVEPTNAGEQMLSKEVPQENLSPNSEAELEDQGLNKEQKAEEMEEQKGLEINSIDAAIKANDNELDDSETHKKTKEKAQEQTKPKLEEKDFNKKKETNLLEQDFSLYKEYLESVNMMFINIVNNELIDKELELFLAPGLPETLEPFTEELKEYNNLLRDYHLESKEERIHLGPDAVDKIIKVVKLSEHKEKLDKMKKSIVSKFIYVNQVIYSEEFQSQFKNTGKF